jgi:hypothetical protein
MTRIQFGWSLPSGPPEGMSRNAYMEGVQKGFELIKGHFDSFWFVDHLQSENDPLLEQMQEFVDLGVDYFMLQSGGFPDLTTLELLVSEVMPALNR